jgi:ribonuclease I
MIAVTPAAHRPAAHRAARRLGRGLFASGILASGILVGGLVLAGGALAPAAFAATPLATAGTAGLAPFVAERVCPLYQSKNKRTNPDGAQTAPGQAYPVVEALPAAGAPTWLRVQVAGGAPPERWVEAACGRQEAGATAAGGVPGAAVMQAGVSSPPPQPSPGQGEGANGAAVGGGSSMAIAAPAAPAAPSAQPSAPPNPAARSSAPATAATLTAQTPAATQPSATTPRPAPAPAATAPAPAGATCHTPGAQDAYVLSLSWQAAFCEIHGRAARKPECLHESTTSPEATRFTLHGLWPNRRSCGADYGFCPDGRAYEARRCEAPAVTLSEPVQRHLAAVMPNARDENRSRGGKRCLQDHEWAKHGTCTGLSPDAYFDLAARLVDEIDATPFVRAFIAGHVGQEVTRAALAVAFEESFGAGTARRMEPVCDRHDPRLLTEIRLALPPILALPPAPGPAGGVKALLAAAGEARHDGHCAATLYLDPPGQSQ